MESINLLHCIDRSADYSNRRSYLLLWRQVAPGQYRLLQSGEISQNACSIILCCRPICIDVDPVIVARHFADVEAVARLLELLGENFNVAPLQIEHRLVA